MSRTLLALAAVFLLTACGQQHPPVASTTGDDPGASAPPASTQTAAQEASSDAEGLQASYRGFPDFDPPYPGATDVSGGTLGAHQGLGGFSTTDTPEQVGAFFARTATAHGLQPRQDSTVGVVYTGAGAAGDLVVSAFSAGGLTHVTTHWNTPA